MESENLLLSIIIGIILFIVIVMITRWVFSISTILKYQRAITYLLFKSVQKDLSEKEVDFVLYKILEGEISKEVFNQEKDSNSSEKKDKDDNLPSFVVSE